MLRLLLDENISPAVADGLMARRPAMSISSIYRWRSGLLKGQPDPVLLRAAGDEALTLVTYDVTTIRPLLNEWRSLGLSQAGVILVPARSLPSHDFGGLIRALEALWDAQRDLVWTNRLEFLRPA